MAALLQQRGVLSAIHVYYICTVQKDSKSIFGIVMFESQIIHSLNALPQQIHAPVHQLHKVSLQLDPSP